MGSAIPHLHFPVTLKPNPRLRKKKTNFPPAIARARATAIKACSLPAEASPLFMAAKHTVDTYIKSGMVIGLGSGQASGMAIEYLGWQLRAGALTDIVGIPTSVVSASEAAKAGIPLAEYENNSQIDFAFGDVDIIEERTLISVIGRRRSQGEESIIREKLNWMETAEEIDDLFLGDAEVWRRPSIGHADPHGGDFPLVTREGHNILDVIFTSPIASLAEVAQSLENIDGVVDHGVVFKFRCKAIVASESGLSIVDNVPTNAVGGA